MDIKTWQKPKTAKRYLQPSCSERVCCLWTEGKITMSENFLPLDVSTSNVNKSRVCSGVWAVHGSRANMMDFKSARLHMQEDGIPVHGLAMDFEGFEMQMEAFCDTARRSTCYAKITVTNKAPYKASEPFGLVLRTGKERDLVYGAPDGYCSHAPEVSAFKAAPVTFIGKDNVLRDGKFFVGFRSEIPLRYDIATGILWAEQPLESEGSYEIYLTLGIGDFAGVDFDYEVEKNRTVEYWKNQFSKLCLPSKIENDPEKLRLVKNLTVQILQCYAHYVDKDFLVPRQGALQPFVWVWDQYPVLEAISRMGAFGELYRGAISLYFDELQREDGEIRTFGEIWSTDTACALLSLCSCALNANDAALWQAYRDKAARAFDWILSKRRSTERGEDVVVGLFPPMRGSDHTYVFQNWKTDIWNLFALKEYAACIEHFGGDASVARAEYQDYLRVMRAAFAAAVAPQKDSDALHIPLMPKGDDRYLLEEQYYFYLLHGIFLYSGVIDEIEFPRVYRAMEREGISSGNGLYGHMRPRNGNTHIWYTTAPEVYIFRTALRAGDRARAKEILNALLSYSMSEEYHMCERFCDNDPWFVPWMPNASAMGRVLTMLLDLNAD